MSVLRLVALAVGIVAYAVLSYWMMVEHPGHIAALLLLLAPMWLTAVGFAGKRFGRIGAVVALLAGAGACALLARGVAGNPLWLYLIQHVVINGMLALWFGASLRAGRLSLIGSLAQRLHPLTDDHRRYTWKVTRAWTVYFVATAVLSVLLFVFAPIEVWSAFVNLVSPIGIAVLFIGEFVLRFHWHPEFERTTMAQAIRAFRSTSADPAARG